MAWFKNLTLGKKFLIIFLALIYIFVWSLAGFLVGKKLVVAKEEKPVIGSLLKEDIVPEIANVPNPINGVFYTKKEAETWKNKVPLAVTIENSIKARPQHSGLSRADIVYEALAEGGITRFAAIFLSNSSQAGPVRSAREYYFDWILEYKAAYAHWGGNQYARNLASQLFGKKDLDEFVSPEAYWKTCAAGTEMYEHCGYTSTDKLWELASKRGINNFTSFDSWQFKEDTPLSKPTAGEITVNFQGDPGYVVVWRYDQATNTYKRFNGGSPHIDKENGQQIASKTIIAEYLTDLGSKEVTPGVKNRVFQTIGSGKAKIFFDGSVIDTTWKKDSRDGRTKFFDSSGKEISLNRGQIWMEMVPESSTVSWK